MNRLSESRISHLAHLILDGLKKDNLVSFTNDGRALAETKQAVHEFFQRDDHFDSVIRKKILSLSRHIPPGSR